MLHLHLQGVEYDSLKGAAFARGLLEDDAEFDRCLHEAAESRMPAQLRGLFATILAVSAPVDPAGLWATHKASMSEDFLHQARQVCNINSLLCFHSIWHSRQWQATIVSAVLLHLTGTCCLYGFAVLHFKVCAFCAPVCICSDEAIKMITIAAHVSCIPTYLMYCLCLHA